MATYLLTWNSTKYPWYRLQGDIAELRTRGSFLGRWSCGSTRRIRYGDRVFLMRLGREPRGIIASGIAVHEPYEHEHWDPESESPLALYVDVDWDALLDVESEPEAIISWDTLKTEVPLPHNWTPQASGVRIPSEEADQLEELWSQLPAVQSPTRPDADRFFVQGKVYRRRHLHRLFGGQRQGGISTPAGQPFILLFTGETGEPYDYQDQWTEDGLFFYTGEGQQGDMTFVRGNRAIRDHVTDGKDLHLFEYFRKRYVRYTGQTICTGFHEHQGPDIDGQDRNIIVFELAPIDGFTAATEPDSTRRLTQPASLTTLRERAFAASTYAATPTERLTQAHHRSRDVRNYVLARANGICEACEQPAPFKTPSGRPFLETHHIRSLSDAGPDDPVWVAAVCPNCHRRAHYGEDAPAYNERIARAIADKERQLAG